MQPLKSYENSYSAGEACSQWPAWGQASTTTTAKKLPIFARTWRRFARFAMLATFSLSLFMLSAMMGSLIHRLVWRSSETFKTSFTAPQTAYCATSDATLIDYMTTILTSNARKETDESN